MLNRDIEVLKGNANISKLRSVSISAKSLKPTAYIYLCTNSVIISELSNFLHDCSNQCQLFLCSTS